MVFSKRLLILWSVDFQGIYIMHVYIYAYTKIGSDCRYHIGIVLFFEQKGSYNQADQAKLHKTSFRMNDPSIPALRIFNAFV